MAKPFHVAFLGMGTSFMYTDGVLCYATEGGQLRLLDIKNSADHELVIDVFRMLREHKETIPQFSEPEFSEHKLKPIHYGHGVLACELKLKNNDITRYLIVMKTRTPELLIFEEQPLHDKTLVNTTEKDLFLCHPVRGALWNYWGVRQFDLGTGQWVHSLPFFYTHAPRQDDGVATAIYEDHFYVVSGREPLFRHGPIQTEDGPRPLIYRLALRAPLAGLPELPLQ
ncbi:hypothetical protein IMZ48_00570, partial [Candidatus Bathyarchaeota archaeon]|nr:hypothetical protein [Candidatus Bathyarchaeota archaeon]